MRNRGVLGEVEARGLPFRAGVDACLLAVLLDDVDDPLAGIPTGTLHTLRHTAATLALTEGVPVHIVAARLGDDPNTVLSTYAHLLPQSDELAAERVAALLAG